MTATLFRHLNEQDYKFSMITTGISSHVWYLLEEKGVRSFVERTSVANETENLSIWGPRFKLNQYTITNKMKVSVAGTSLKESEKKVYES